MKILNKPFPLEVDFYKNLQLSITIGLFIFLFLFFFQPISGIYEEKKMDLFSAMSYGFITVATILIFNYFIPIILPNTYAEEKWTVKKEIIHYSIAILLIALFNYLLTLYFIDTTIQSNDTSRSLDLIIPLFASTFLIAIFPIIGLIFYKQNILLKQYLAETKSINQTLNNRTEVSKITLKGEGKSEFFEMDYKQLNFIKSQGNYCEVFLYNDAKPFLLRNSLIKIQEQLVNTKIYKCHRSYLVNLEKVIKVSGNAQGLRLHFENLKESVPVSRNLSKEIKELLTK